jgi:hypothetical protein
MPENTTQPRQETPRVTASFHIVDGKPQRQTGKPRMPEWMKMTIAASGGVTTSFLAFLTFTVMQSGAMRGQVVAGDPVANSALPTTFNAFQASLLGQNPIMNAMTSYMWWTGVLLGGAVCAWFFLGFLRARFG